MKPIAINTIALLCLFCSLNTKSQPLTNITTETPNQYYLQVKQFSEFIDRFNYKTDWKGNRIDSVFANKYPRKAYINYLLNANDPRLTSLTDSSYIKQCAAFIKDVVKPESPLTISLFNGQVTAKALVNFSYLNEKHVASVYFNTEVLNDRSAKWVISKVETSCFTNIADSLTSYFIAPNSHETSFINLKRIEALSNPIFFMSPEINNDTTLLFMTEIAAGLLQIKNIEKITYLVSFTGWDITVEEFMRSSYNSGWLISDVKKL